MNDNDEKAQNNKNACFKKGEAHLYKLHGVLNVLKECTVV